MKHTSITTIFITIAILLGGCTQAGVSATQATAQAVSSSAAAGQTEAALSLTQTASIPPPSETPLPTPTALPTQTATSLPTETSTLSPTETAVPTETPLPTATPYVSIFDTMSDEEIVAIYENMPNPIGQDVKKYGWSTRYTGKSMELSHRIILTGKIQMFEYNGIEIDAVETIFVDFDSSNNPVIRKAWHAFGYYVPENNVFALDSGYYMQVDFYSISQATSFERPEYDEHLRENLNNVFFGQYYYAYLTKDYIDGGYYDASSSYFSFDQLVGNPCFGCYTFEGCVASSYYQALTVIWANYETDSGGVINYFLTLSRGEPSTTEPMITGFNINLSEYVVIP
ncbi:MAG TPA: hypothetical protein PKM21_19110 [Anaerolineales bacterium]|nr:hypothetical protein [Anaerolineales bacterium]